MALHDPIAIFIASSNFEAHEVRLYLSQHGVEAHVVEDASGVGLWLGGTISGIHTPRVWVNRSEAERAVEMIQMSPWAEERGSTQLERQGVDNQCLSCGAEFPEQAAKCPSCGWSFATDGEAS